MATTKKLDPFGKGGATQIGGNQGAGSALIQTAVNGAAAGANAMLNRLNGTQGTSYVSAPKTPQVNVGTPYLYNAQSSFGDSGSMTATNAANAGSGNVSVSPYLNTQYTNVSPMDYNAPTMPVYAGEYDPRASADAYKQAINNAFDYTKPQDYNMYYGSQLDSIVNNVANRGQFSYDPNTDPVYQAYRKQYAREGQRATQDTMAAAAGMTGGVPSSYAVSAAQQAGNYYASQMSDKLPELYNQAYNRYLQEYQNQLSALSAVNNAEQLRHNIWSGNNQNQWKGIGMDYDIHRDTVNDAYNAATLDRSLSNDEWARYVDMLNQYNTDRNFDYGQLTDQMNWERQNEGTGYERAWNEENRDYTRSVYDDETAYNRQQDMYNRAVEMAKLGDYSLMEQLGLDTTYIRALNEAGLTDLNNQAAARLLRGSGSSGSSGGSKTSGSGGSEDGGEPVLEDETVTDEGFGEEIESRIDSIINAAQRNGNAVTDRNDWEFLREYLGDDWLASNGYKFGEGKAVTDLSADRQRTIEYYRRLYPDGIVTNATDWATIAGIYGNAGNAQKTGGFSFVGNYNSSAQTDKGTTTYTPPKEEIVGPMPGYGNNKLMPYQEIATAARTGTMPVTSKTGGLPNGSSSGSKSLATGKSASGRSSSTSSSSSAAKAASSPDFVGGQRFADSVLAARFASKYGVPAERQKYYSEREFNAYKQNNADPSLKQYRTYQDYLKGYTNYLITEYGTRISNGN